MMIEFLFTVIALLTGVVLGFLFFGGLWLTIRRALTAKIPALWFLGSFILRMGFVMAGFYLIMQPASWVYGLICLVGFITARYIVIRMSKSYEKMEKDSQNLDFDSMSSGNNSLYTLKKPKVKNQISHEA